MPVRSPATHAGVQAENERMHLLTFLKLQQPGWFMRTMVLFTQVGLLQCTCSFGKVQSEPVTRDPEPSYPTYQALHWKFFLVAVAVAAIL